jgi:hypothetical protein
MQMPEEDKRLWRMESSNAKSQTLSSNKAYGTKEQERCKNTHNV